MSRWRGDLRAFLAAGLKEWRTIRRYPTFGIGLLFWPIALPFMYVLQARAFSGGDPRADAAFAERAGTGEIAGFLYIGYSVYMWLSIVLWGPGTSLRSEQVRGSLEALFVTPSSRLVILFGPAVAHIAPALWMFTLVGVTLWLAFGVPIAADTALRALAVVAAAIPALYGLGALFSTLVLRVGEIQGPVQVLRGVFTALCGMTFPIVVLPDLARSIALALPPTYLIRDLRAVLLTGADVVDLVPDLAILLGSGALLCTLAWIAFRRTERYARLGGQLAQY